MRYRVHTTRRAEADVAAIFDWIASTEERPLEAVRWLEELERALLSLRSHPRRCPRAPESAFLGREVRQILLHRHRVLFTIEGHDVWVLHIRHGSRRLASSEDIVVPDS